MCVKKKNQDINYRLFFENVSFPATSSVCVKETPKPRSLTFRRVQKAEFSNTYYYVLNSHPDDALWYHLSSSIIVYSPFTPIIAKDRCHPFIINQRSCYDYLYSSWQSRVLAPPSTSHLEALAPSYQHLPNEAARRILSQSDLPIAAVALHSPWKPPTRAQTKPPSICTTSPTRDGNLRIGHGDPRGAQVTTAPPSAAGDGTTNPTAGVSSNRCYPPQSSRPCIPIARYRSRKSS